jgi:hypothetical protein
MPWTFFDSSGRKLNTASTLIDNLDIDGATDIGAAIVDEDLFIIDDGAGGTNRKTEASRIKTYIGSTLTSTVESFARTASAGAGAQALTGAGFAPKAAILFAGDGNQGAAWGFVDDADGARNIYHNAQNSTLTTSIWSLTASAALNVRNNTSASDQMSCTAALTASGITLTWSKSNSGVDAVGYVLYLG